MREIVLNRQLLGLEDLLFGVGIVTQIRAGQSVNVTRINAGNLPFDETQSLLEWTQSVNLDILGSMTTELQAIYDNLIVIGNVEDNLVVINSLEDNLLVLQSLHTNMTKLQAIYTDLTKLESIYDNLTMLLAIYNNLATLNNINSQVIPNLTELLLVNDNAAQVAADKLTVATDKSIVAGYKDDVSSMKVAVESIYDTFDDRFLGVKTSDPILDNDGNTLQDGAMYFNGSSNALKVYSLDNTTWYTIPQIYLSGLLDVTLTSITTGDILTWNGTKWINTRTPSFDSVKLNGGTGTQGTATWNNTELTYDLVLNDNVTLQVGQEEVVYCKNNTLTTIPNGKPVMAVGTNGNSGNILVDLHDGTKASAKRVIGLTTQPILPSNNVNPYGFVTRNGKVRGLNTTGSDYGETWVDGDILYVKATGALTKVEPADTALKMPIAFVIHSHTNGTLYVRTTGIDENHDRDLISTKVAKVTSTDNAVVRFNGLTGEVQNSGVVIDDNNNVGIGVINPNSKLDIRFSPFTGQNQTNRILLQSLGSTAYNTLGSKIGITFNGRTTDFTTNTGIGTASIYGVNEDNSQYGRHQGLAFYTSAVDAVETEKMRIDSSGNVGIGVTPSSVSKLQAKTGANRNISISDQVTISGAATIEAIDDTRGSNIPLELRGTTISITRPSGTTCIFDSAGNVGIGVTPSAWNNAAKAIQLGTNTSVFNYSNGMYIRNNAYFDASGVNKYITNGSATSFDSVNGAYIWAIAPSGIAGNAVTWTTAMTLDTSGNLIVGGNSTPPVILARYDFNNYIYIQGRNVADTTEVYINLIGGVKKSAILANGTYQSATNVYGSTSDIKLKENVVETSDKLNKLMNVRVVNFNYIGDDQKQIGVIAQEIEQVFPGVVFETKDTKQVEVTKTKDVTDEDGNVTQEEYTETETVETGEVTKNVKYSVIYMMMLKGMQEMRAEYTAEIESLKSRIEILEGAK